MEPSYHRSKSQEYYQKNKDLYKARCIARKRAQKKRLVEYVGGKCSRCGYDKCINALEFHHVDPSTKEFTIGKVRDMAWTKLIAEVDKCILVCANCHREIEDGT